MSESEKLLRGLERLAIQLAMFAAEIAWERTDLAAAAGGAGDPDSPADTGPAAVPFAPAGVPAVPGGRFPPSA